MNFPGSLTACPTCNAAPGVRCPAMDPRREGHAHRTRIGRESQAMIDCPVCPATREFRCIGQAGPQIRPHKDRTDAYLQIWPVAAESPSQAEAEVPPSASGSAALPTDRRNVITHGDALTQMKKLPDGCVDLVVTSPPYNRMNTTGGGLRGKTGRWPTNPLAGGGYNVNPDNLPVAEYIDVQRQVVHEMARLLAPGGAIFYVHSPRHQRGAWEEHGETIMRSNKLPRGFQIRHKIIWNKGGGFNFNSGRFPRSYEVIYVLAREGEWNHPETMEFPDVWQLGNDIVPRGVPSFPLELPRRAMRCTPGGMVVLDPFMGSGTTAVAAILQGWSYVGIDLDEEMVQSANRRIRHAEMTQTDWTPDDTDTVPDTVPPDTLAADTVPDTVPPDTLAADTVPDTVPPDTLAADTVPDTVPPDTLAADTVPDTVPPDTLAADTVPDTVPPDWVAAAIAGLTDEERAVWDYVSEASDAIFGQPPTLSQTKIGADLGGKGRKAVNRIVVSLQRKGLLTLDNARRGASVYYQAGRHSTMLDGEVRASAITHHPSGTVSGTVSAGAGAAGEVNQGSIVNPPAAPAPDGASLKNFGDSVKPPPCDDCGPAEIYPSRALQDRGVVGAWYCNGHARSCSWVWQQDVGVVVPPSGKRRYDYDRLASLIQAQIVEGHPRGQKPVWVSTDDDPGARRREARTPYADAARAEFGKLAWECRPKRGG